MKRYAARLPRRRMLPLSFIPWALVLLLWIALPAVVKVPAYKLPSVGDTLRDLWSLFRDGSLPAAIGETMLHIVLGIGIGTVAAVVAGLAFALSEKTSRFAMPIVNFFQAVAGIAWVPFAIIWFGLGTPTVVFVTVYSVFFVVLQGTMLGIRSIPRTLDESLMTLGATRKDIVLYVIVPGALVSVLSGLRGGIAYGWRACVASELIVGSGGLGYLTARAGQQYDGASVIVGIFVIGLIWVAMNRFVVRSLEIRTVERWGMLRREGGAARLRGAVDGTS